MKSMAGIALVLALFVTCPQARATTARYDYAGVVEFCDDSAIGGGICGVLVSLGDLISGFAELDSAGGLANRVFTAADVVDYFVTVEGGALSGATPDNSVIDATSSLVTDELGMLVAGELSILVDPTLLPVAINADITSQTWEIVLFPGALDLVLAGGSGGFGAPVPLPGAVWLFASALWVVARRNRAGRAADVPG